MSHCCWWWWWWCMCYQTTTLLTWLALKSTAKSSVNLSGQSVYYGYLGIFSNLSLPIYSLFLWIFNRVTTDLKKNWKTWSTRDFCEHGKLGAFCATSGKILTNRIASVRTSIRVTQQGHGLKMDKVSWISSCRWSQCVGDLLYWWSWCGITLDIRRSLLHFLFVAITYLNV